MTRSARIESTFAVLEAAAIAGERCPMSAPHCADGINGHDVSVLVKTGRVLIEISSRNWRVITILTGPNAGRSTAADPDPRSTPHLTVSANGRTVNREPACRVSTARRPSAPRPLTREELFR
jgi:hypothetical protein